MSMLIRKTYQLLIIKYCLHNTSANGIFPILLHIRICLNDFFHCTGKKCHTTMKTFAEIISIILLYDYEINEMVNVIPIIA